MITLRDAANSILGITADETTKEITTEGNLNTPSINTGQGDNEVYDMDQGVKTTDSPEFAGLTIDGQNLSSYVLKSTTISTTSPLTGGGDLTTNRTFAIPAATASIDGYATSTQITKLDGIANSANNYSLPVASTILGGVKSGTDITVDESGNVSVADTAVNFFNGIFRESFDFRLTSDGTTITGTLTNPDTLNVLTMRFSDGITMLDVTSLSISITEGTIINPQVNYIYIPFSTKVMTEGSDWPDEQHIKIAKIAVQTAASVKAEGALKNQNHNDDLAEWRHQQGHLTHITDKLRQFEAQWSSGTEGSTNIGLINDEVWFTVTAGKIYQMHKQDFPLFVTQQYSIDAVTSSTFTLSGDGDLSSTFPDDVTIKINNSTTNDGKYTVASTLYTDPNFVITTVETIPDTTIDGTIGDDVTVINKFEDPYFNVLDLSDILLDSIGDTLTNQSFSVVLWGVANKTDEPSHLMVNMPSGSYSKNSPGDAVSDASNYSNYTISSMFQGVGFLIARFTYINTSGVWSLHDTEDLRGKVPNITAGGGAGGTGVTSFLGLLDTPSAYTGKATNVPQINAGATALEFVTKESLNNISSTNATNLTDGGSTILHSHDIDGGTF